MFASQNLDQQQIKHTLDHPLERFNRGDYVYAALRGDRSSWQYWAALGLSGQCQQAIAALSQIDHAEARFYLGVTHWIAGDDAAASAILKTCQSEHAQNLLTYISKPEINLLAMVPPNWMPHLEHDPKFKVRSIGALNPREKIPPYASIQTLMPMSYTPDLFLCSPIEWHDVPPDIQDLTCPIIGATSDYDSHIQRIHPWLKVFDEFIVGSPAEWADLTKLVDQRVSTFAKFYGYDGPMGPISAAERRYDLFFSGSLLNPYMHEKAELLHRVMELNDVNLKTVLGFSTDYYSYLTQSKVTWTHIRRPFNLVTRGTESLAMGCAVIAKRETSLALFVGEQDGLLQYEDNDELLTKIRMVLSQWDDFKQRARVGAAKIRQEFHMSRSLPQWLRFMTFVAARPRPTRTIIDTERFTQKIAGFIGGCWEPWAIETRAVNALAKLSSSLSGPTTDARPFLDAAREMTLEICRADYPPAYPGSPPIALVRGLDVPLGIYDLGINRLPQNLVLRFNRIRLILHAGTRSLVSQSLDQALRIVATPQNAWTVNPLDDILPADFFRGFINYRRYMDAAFESIKTNTDHCPELVSVIYASLHFYLSHYTNSVDHLEQALRLDPDFAPYKYHLAHALIRAAFEDRTAQSKATQAGDILMELCQKTFLFEPAAELLKRLSDEGLYHHPEFSELKGRFDKFLASTDRLDAEPWLDVQLQPCATIPRALGVN